MLRIVLDTSVLVAAVRSRRGGSFELLSRVGRTEFDLAISVGLVFEYEAVLLRHIGSSDLTATDMRDLVDYICEVAIWQEVFFLWRPFLRDPNDDLVLELAVAAGCNRIVTHNVRDFAGVEQFGIRVVTPAEFLTELRG